MCPLSIFWTLSVEGLSVRTTRPEKLLTWLLCFFMSPQVTRTEIKARVDRFAIERASLQKLRPLTALALFLGLFQHCQVSWVNLECYQVFPVHTFNTILACSIWIPEEQKKNWTAPEKGGRRHCSTRVSAFPFIIFLLPWPREGTQCQSHLFHCPISLLGPCPFALSLHPEERTFPFLLLFCSFCVSTLAHLFSPQVPLS